MGILDSFFSDNPNDAAYTALMAGLLSGKGSFGGILGKSLMDAQGVYGSVADSNLKNQYTKLQIDEAKRKAKQQETALADQENFRNMLIAQGSPEMRASQAALAAGGGPTVENAAKISPVDPTQSLMFKALETRQLSPLDFLKLTQKDAAPQKVGAGERVYSHDYKTILADNPKEQDPNKGLPSGMRMGPNGPEWIPGYLDAQMMLRKAGAANVSVNTGEKGLKNELAIKQDFKTEPIYKDYTEMVSAYKQIKAGINQATPIGDLTTATKIMKLLDPTSVVRESELGMAMAATGRMDRLKHFVDIQIKGNKLTPQQRKEFGALADELYDAAGQAYNQKRSEYENIAKRYELDTQGLGPKHKPVRKSMSIREQADAILNGE